MGLIVGYRVVRLTELMTYEFGQVEGDIERLDERTLGSALPQGMSYSSFMDKLKRGELALLTDSPSKPVMLQDGMSKSWELSTEGQEALSPEAKNAYLSRTIMSGGAAGGAPSRGGASEPSIDETYVPEPVKPNQRETTSKIKYEYCFEIACSDETFKQNIGCAFELAKTKQEPVVGRWETERTDHGTKYTAYTAFDEPKKLVAKVASSSMGISVPESVQVKPIGSGVVREAFIPVVPSVQLGERLGLPTEGYYYHFYNGRLVQEYKLLGNGKWAFYATRSTHEQLNDEQGYNIYQSAILVYWKLEGKDVENQHLIYLEQPITREELDNLDDDWLAQHGIKLDINELLAAPKQPVAERQTTQPAETEKAESKPETHTVGTDSKTNQRESWGAIAEQYGLSAKQLLDLNPQYNADPMSLKVGDRLTVKAVEENQSTPEKATALPLLSPCTYSCLANTHYDYSDSLISGTQFKAINSDSLFEKELPVTNLTTITTASKATDYGKVALLSIPANGAATNLGILSSSTTNTIGSWSISGEALKVLARRMGGVLVGALWPSQLGDATLDGNPDFATGDTTTMRVRFNMYTDENGKQQVVGIKTGEGSAYGERVAKREAVQQGQHFVAELDNGITITWTPDGSTDVLTPDTVLPENDQLDVHNIWVRPIEEHQQEIGTALYPEEELAEYIVTFPADSGVSPLYLVFNKRSAGITKVKPLEVGTYGDLAPRSKKDGMDIDHIPSFKAIEKWATNDGQPLTAKELAELKKATNGIAIPHEVHKECSRTYGGRNQPDQSTVDSQNLRKAAQKDMEAITLCLKEHGYSDSEIEHSFNELHKLNEESGIYD
ncbi:S-type pyocin domain-containing protein [Vibrio sp. RM-69-4]|uniref:T6SS effector antibacterial DNase n=1 Tax=Vibrio sp. RM-69-4 TaxID=2950157 RepID=UPI00215C682A|nr:S-type pyocin domain-containing protein [Vibrio sp. RM-69-4]MCR9421544.1 S-type pyocin domain-containing protein [Vibrio sp. RM-69-4]